MNIEAKNFLIRNSLDILNYSESLGWNFYSENLER
jgi:hypothetical protein